MTPDEFAGIIVEGDLDKIALAVAGMDERQRSKLSRITVQIHEEFDSGNFGASFVPTSKPTLFALRERLRDRFRPRNSACKLALMAVGPFAKAKAGLKFWAEYSEARFQEAFLRVIIDRRPDWIDRWIEAELDSSMSHLISWTAIRSLIRAGACRKHSTRAYWRWMVHAVWGQSWQTKVPISTILVEDADLLEDVWKLFEVETRALCLGTADEAVASRPDCWPAALIELSQQGELDRQRLLDASLKALSSGFMDDVLTGYIRFFEQLQPTIDELVCRQPVFLALLANPASRVVTFALEKIRQLDQVQRLDCEAFLTGMSPVFQTRTKGQPIAAIRLVEQIVKRSPAHLPHAVQAILEALSHPSAEVQAKAICFMEASATRLHPDHLVTIRERLGDIAASVRGRAEALVGTLLPLKNDSPEPPCLIGAFEEKVEELARSVSAMPARSREHAGVDSALGAIRAGQMPEPLTFVSSDVPVLTGVEPIVPIVEVGDLIDCVAHAAEAPESADDVERVLDGICRLWDQRPADFERRTNALVKRIEESRLERGTRGIATMGLVSESFYQLLMMWLRGSVPLPRCQGGEQVAIDRFLDCRLQEMIHRLRDCESGPMIAAPTHTGGWIDASILIDRVVTLEAKGLAARECDVIQALLRLAPDGRDMAIQRAAELQGSVGRVLRWALGGTIGPAAEDARYASMWLAAGRSRQPRGDLSELTAVGITSDFPDAAVHATYEWHSKQIGRNRTGSWDQHQPRPIKILEHPSASFERCLPMWPTVALHDRRHNVGFFPAWRIEMLAQVWPLCLDPFFAQAAYSLGERLDQPASTLEPNCAYLKPLLQPDCPWTQMAILAVCVAVVSKDSDARTSALDAIIEGISYGRAHPCQISAVLLRLMSSDWFKLNRVVDALAEVARCSELHTWFTVEVLQGILVGLDPLPRDAHFVLSLLRELLVDLGMAISPMAARPLEAVHGTSKTAKTATALRELQGQSNPEKLRQAGLQLLESRIARAKRWSVRSRDHSGAQA
jgi:hypothetical protein